MQTRKTRNALIRAFLVAHYPKCFCPPRTIKNPLKIGIADDIRRLHPEIIQSHLREALADYAGAPRYKAGLVEGAPRLDLFGNAVGFVTPEQAARARAQLDSYLNPSHSGYRSPVAIQQAAE